ncbi:MAG: Txe/YoeB family addiction module toxin [Firmicutes bacterium]|nr:Txe/YoeB family addiction module toxin [Bacillota bacterium]
MEEVKIYKIEFTKQAEKDWNRITDVKVLKKKAITLLKILKENPYKIPPKYEKLVGDLLGSYSRRINQQHRLVYSVDEAQRSVRIIRMWTHYEK